MFFTWSPTTCRARGCRVKSKGQANALSGNKRRKHAGLHLTLSALAWREQQYGSVIHGCADPSYDGSFHGLLAQWRLQRRALALQLLGQRPRCCLGCIGTRPAGWVAVHVQWCHLALDRHHRHYWKHCCGGHCLRLHFLMNICLRRQTHTRTRPAFSGSLDPQVKPCFVDRNIYSLSMSLSLFLCLSLARLLDQFWLPRVWKSWY